MYYRSIFAGGIVVTCVIVVGVWVCRAFGQSIVREPTTMATSGSLDHPASPLDFVVKDIDGKDVNLSQYHGKVVLLVNVASRCGFTPQYAGLEKLYEKYKDNGFVILGFPANNFHGQEPGSNEDIKAFCIAKYNVTFPMMAKISVKDDDKAPLYKFLTEAPTAGEFAGNIGWNFTKFVVDKNGNVIARFGSKTKPDAEELIGVIEKALAMK